MTFYLQYRDAPSDSPLVEFQSPLPLPVPAKGDRVTLFGASAADGKITGVVDRVEWGYQPHPAATGHPMDAGTDAPASLDVQARVWLSQD